MNTLLTKLDGNKTYITAILIVVYAALGLFLGYHSVDDAIKMILGALGLIGVRSAIKKVE